MKRTNQIGRARQIAAGFADQSHSANSLLLRDHVVAMLQPHGELAQTVAYLRGTAASGTHSLEQLEKDFGTQVAHSVELLPAGRLLASKQVGADQRSEPWEAYYPALERLKADSEHAVALVVLAAAALAEVEGHIERGDRDALRKIRRMYRRLRHALRREGLADEFWRQLGGLVTTRGMS